MINIDLYPLEDAEEAAALMFHHLKIAAAYFEAMPLNVRTPEHFSKPAMIAWLEAMEALYPELTA